MIDPGFESVSIADSRAHGFDWRIFHFDHAIATMTNQMVMSMWFEHLVDTRATAQIGFRDDAGIAKSLQCAVHRRPVDDGIGAFQLLEHLIRG